MRQILFIIALFIISTSGYCQSNTENNNDLEKLYPSKSIESRYHNNWTQRHYRDRIKVFKKEPLSYGDIVFIGNSITEQGRDWSEKFGIKNIRNRGIAGDVTDGVLKRLDEVTHFQPKAVFVLIGINDLFSIHHDADNRHKLTYDNIVPSPKYVAKNILKITKIIQRKCPDTKVYVRTLLPTRRDYLKDDILIVNNYIKQYESKGLYEIIDLYAHFVNEEGEMIKELTKDGVHLNDKGYARWIEIEKEIISFF